MTNEKMEEFKILSTEDLGEETPLQAVELGGFHMPDVRKQINYDQLSDYMTVRRHQFLHVLWDKLKDGFTIGWTFEELYREHKLTLNKLKELKLIHLKPINELDIIHI